MRFQIFPDRIHGCLCRGTKDGVRGLLQLGELGGCQFLQRGVAIHALCVTLTHGIDAELRIVAIHHNKVVPAGIVQVTCRQDRKGRFADTALLGGEGNENRFLFHFIFCLMVLHICVERRMHALACFLEKADVEISP